MTFSKVLNVKSPERGHDTDAGLDFLFLKILLDLFINYALKILT